MTEYFLSKINYDDKISMKKLYALLEKENITLDKNLEYTVGMFDDDYKMIATGSCFKNTLRCIAVDSEKQGKGILNTVISHLIEYQFGIGNTHLFIYTKTDKAKFFKDLGFHEIVRIEDKVSFMENKSNGFKNYLKSLKEETDLKKISGKSAAVIMNANPFTLGHQYLLEEASSKCDLLHVFVVSEDISLVPFNIRYKLVKEGTSHLKNIVCHKTKSYMISGATFPSYFLKDEDLVIKSHAQLDIEIFMKIAQSLKISARFIGEEPFSKVTSIYNSIMKNELNKNGIDCIIIPRKSNSDGIISASKVRKLIHDGDIEKIKDYVPRSTYDYFISPESINVINKIKSSLDVIHY